MYPVRFDIRRLILFRRKENQERANVHAKLCIGQGKPKKKKKKHFVEASEG